MVDVLISRAAPLQNRNADGNPLLCDYTLREVLSWLEVTELLSGAALVSKRWCEASQCREVWRRRMHRKILNLFINGKIPGHPMLSPARLFQSLYQSNLLVNSTFLERSNSLKPGQSPRRSAWEPTHSAHGMTWAHPFNFYPELSPLPEAINSSKPFSVGCLATGPLHNGEWSEVVQVVDLSTALQAQGIPVELVPQVLGAGLPVELSVYVAGGPLAGGEYQVVMTLMSAVDVTAAAEAQVPLAAIPKMTLPFGHPPSGSPGIAATAAANLTALGLTGSTVVAKVPLQPTPGEWSGRSCRVDLSAVEQPSHILVSLRGRATRNRLGHYATKFASASLVFLTADICS
eukprot:GHUV01011353.1.p1 GENE.GHUV01011353.1~~GHUV01011353.1.p1  ORF type:complete len:346 (+),score=72.49 GHUV01011353.1:107-1144(+)